jgi:hypothetical protein
MGEDKASETLQKKRSQIYIILIVPFYRSPQLG